MLYKSISVAASGDNQILAGVANMRIRVASYVIVAAGAVTAKWRDGSSTQTQVDASGAMSLITGTPVAAAPHSGGAFGQYGHMETSPGQDLTLNLGGAIQVSGHLTYELVR